MAIVYVPTPLRRLTGGQARVQVEGSDLKTLIENLDQEFPGFKDRLLDEEQSVKRFINIFVNGEDVRRLQGLSTQVGESDEVSIIPAMAGGVRLGDEVA
jgi:molybdopterin synthase sulfur carrier subunit